MEYIVFAIPFFFLLIVIEWLVDWRRGTQFCQIGDAITSLNAGVISRINQVFRAFIPFTVYFLIVDSVSIVEWPNHWITWVVAFVVYDFCYYWHHRMGHEINLLWAAHVVHHSSEEYNLTTALRQTSGSFIGFIFYLPLAFLGIPGDILIAVASLNLLYQFWVHTRHIPKLGWYEWLFVTPSNHRVHHAINQVYIDKNYGGVFILWDRLFGTFQEELKEEPCLYGVRKPLHSWNPIWANLQVYWQLIKDAWHTQSYKDKLLIWFKPTGWRPKDVEQSMPLAKFNPDTFEKFKNELSLAVSVYLLAQQLGLLTLTFLYLQQLTHFSTLQTLLWGSGIVFSTWMLSLIIREQQSVVVNEILRLGLINLLLWTLSDSMILNAVASLWSIISVLMTLVVQPKPQLKVIE